MVTIESPKWTNHEVDVTPYKGDEFSPKWLNIKQVSEMNGPFPKDDDWKSKMDESKINPHNGRITLKG